MAAVRQQDIDKDTGMVTAGPYAGHHIDEVLEFLETRAAQAATKPAAAEPVIPAAEKTPEQLLDEKVTERTGGLTASIEAQNARFEQDDEAAFSATVPDYDTVFRDTKKTVRALVNQLKQSMHPTQRIQKGIHRQLYMMVKMQDPDTQARIFNQPPAEPEVVAGEQAEPAPPEEPVVPATPPKPKPVAAVPTPASRAATPAAAKKGPKLVGNHKTEAAARAMGFEHNAYLLKLEENGTSQEQLDAMTINRKAGQPGRRTTVFDRA
jgi:hypothetical protein